MLVTSAPVAATVIYRLRRESARKIDADSKNPFLDELESEKGKRKEAENSAKDFKSESQELLNALQK